MHGLDVGNNKVVVGADNAASGAGAVYVYNLDGTGQVKTLHLMVLVVMVSAEQQR